MTVHIKCFASLREQLGIDSVDLEYCENMTVSDVWHSMSDETPPANLLCARNLEYVDFRQVIDDGDEIAFFPPVSGG